MRDYTLAVGDSAPYGFSATDDPAAMRHVADYLIQHRSEAGGLGGAIVLSSPDGLLSLPDEDADAFRRRAESVHVPERTDDVRPADPTPPDCNMA